MTLKTAMWDAALAVCAIGIGLLMPVVVPALQDALKALGALFCGVPL